MIIKLSKELYPKEAIMKAAYNYTDKYTVLLDTDDLYYYVKLSSKNGDTSQNNADDFINEALIQTTRYNIMLRTKNIREIILGRALASTAIDISDDGFADNEEINADNILHNWFDSNG